MNLDDLMAVWRSQDAAPLHGVNKTLLRLALRQDEAKLQKWRRIERWIIYVFSAGFVAGMALFLAMHDLPRRHECADRLGSRHSGRRRGRRPALGARCMWATGRRRCASNALASRFEINSTGSIAQLDYRATKAPPDDMLVIVLLGGICAIAIILARLADQREVLQRRWLHDRLA